MKKTLTIFAPLLLVGSCGLFKKDRPRALTVSDRVAAFILDSEHKEILDELNAELPVSIVIEAATSEAYPTGKQFYLGGLNEGFAGKVISADVFNITDDGAIHRLSRQDFTASYAFFKNSESTAVLKFVVYPFFQVKNQAALYTVHETLFGDAVVSDNSSDFATTTSAQKAYIKQIIGEIDAKAKRAQRMLCPVTKKLICELKPY